MKLITEMTEDCAVLVEQDDAGKKRYCIEGIFLQSNIKNKNGRVYPSEIMEREVNRYITEKVSTKRAYGELGHPAGPQINLERVSHLITSLKKDGNNYIGKATITEGTPYGAIVKGLLESGANLGVSSRGLGSLLMRNGINEVQSDYKIATAADIVADPSAPDAFVSGIMEGVDWIYENGFWKQEVLDEARASVRKAYKSKRSQVKEDVAVALFEKFISSL